MVRSPVLRALAVVTTLACAALAGNACSTDATSVEEDAARDASAIDGQDGASPSSLDGAAADGALVPVGDAANDASDASDAGDPWHTVFGEQLNVNDVLTTPSGQTYVIGARTVGGVVRGRVARLLASGKIDTTFGTAGFADVITSPSAPNQPLRGVLQANGQLVLIGVVYASPWDFVMTRLDAAGAFDTTFGVSGVMRVHVGIGNDLPFGIAAGPAGGFLFTGVAFGATNFASDVVVGRVAANGALDTTFDGDGIATTSLGGVSSGRGVGLVSQDRVLVAAQSDNASDIVLLRYTSAGALDATFSTGQDAGATALPSGAGVLHFPSASLSAAEGMRKDGSGKWVIYGTGNVPGIDAGTTRSAMLAVRVAENGAVDPAFHNGGGPFYPTPTGRSFAYSFASQPSGRALVAGGVYEGAGAFDVTKYWPGIVALDSSGNRDTSALGIFKGIYVPHVYAGNDALVAPLPNGHFVAVSSTATSVEAFEIVP
jgi:uncharacterized delta-60 repeat protein